MSNGPGMRVITGISLALAIAASVGTFVQYNTSTTLTAQLASATAETQKLREQLSTATAAADAKMAVDQQQLQSTQTRLAEESRPDLPIKVTFRPSLLGAGKVALLQNESNHEIEVTLDVQSPATGRHFHQAYVMDPNRITQVGRNEGWEFAPGQQITLNNPKYRPISGTVGG